MRSPQSESEFQHAAADALRFCQARLGMDTWMLLRVEHDRAFVMALWGNGLGIEAGHVFQWPDTICYEMVAGRGPQVAANIDEVRVYSNSPMNHSANIVSYCGVPLYQSDGQLWGTLSAYHSQPLRQDMAEELPMIEFAGRLLVSIFELESKANRYRQIAEQAMAESVTDPLTDVLNRRGWEQALQTEEKRHRRYGHSACLFSIDIDELKQVNDSLGHAAGDELLRTAAQTISSAIRDSDLVARIGGDEFAVLAVECSETGGEQLLARLRSAFELASVPVSIGRAVAESDESFQSVFEKADQAMMEQKRRKDD